MKAILVDEQKRLHWRDVPDPVVRPDEVLVRIEAAGVNRADLMQREGDYPPPPGCPEWMGLEVAGTIVEMGAEAAAQSRWKAGDRVCALLGGGGYAQYVSVRHDMLMPVPEGCTMEEAAAMPEAFATAYLNLFIEGGIRAGDTLLVTGGSSGLASVVIPLAKAFGVRVITTVRSARKAEAIRHLNADIVVNTAEESLADVLQAQLAAGTPVDVTIDCLGGAAVGECLRHLRHGARWIMIAALAGQKTEIDLKNVYVRNVRLIGSTLRSRAPEVKAQILRSLVEEVWPKVTAGQVRPTVTAVLPIEQAEAAHELLYKGESSGKVVLVVK
ncbi:MAG: NAD(P)H-quinone oxidoreductase [Candidatus Spyradocola sp.]